MSELSKNKIKWIRSLRLKKNRDLENLFILEGEKMVLEAIDQSPSLIVTVVALKGYTLPPLNENIEVVQATEEQLSQVSELRTPNKLLAILRKPYFDKYSSTGLRLVLCDIQDPGNLGTILRTADWFGISEVICSKNTVDCFNEKVLQSCMGSILRVRIHYTDLEEFLDNQNVQVYAADLKGVNIYTIDDLKEGFVLMGNEGKGIPPNLEKYITHRISIPKFGGAESLNVGIAAGIIVSEFARRRTT